MDPRPHNERMMKHADTVNLFCAAGPRRNWWVAAKNKNEASDGAWRREVFGKGIAEVRVQRFDYVLGLDRRDCHATLMHRDGTKAWIIDPFIEDPKVLFDVPFKARLQRAKHTDTEASFRQCLSEAGWWILELLDGRHLVEVYGKERIASRRDTRVLLAAWAGNEFDIEPELRQ